MSKQLLKESLLLIDENKHDLNINETQKTKQKNKISTNKWNQKKKISNKSPKLIGKTAKIKDKNKKLDKNTVLDKTLDNIKLFRALNKNKLNHRLVKDLIVSHKTEKIKITTNTDSVFTEKDFKDFALTYK